MRTPFPNPKYTMHKQVAEDDLNAINMALDVKDHYNKSIDAYHEMAQLFKSMPHHYKLRQRFCELNHLWDIRPTPAGTCGVSNLWRLTLFYLFSE